MRSELVFGAMTYVSNRFLLTRVAAMATRRLHRPNTRIQDTANEVFGRFHHASPLRVVPCIGNLEPSLAIAPAGRGVRGLGWHIRNALEQSPTMQGVGNFE
jgi:hypothetical protein